MQVAGLGDAVGGIGERGGLREKSVTRTTRRDAIMGSCSAAAIACCTSEDARLNEDSLNSRSAAPFKAASVKARAAASRR